VTTSGYDELPLSVAAISIQDGRLSSIVWIRVFAVESDCKTPL